MVFLRSFPAGFDSSVIVVMVFDVFGELVVLAVVIFSSIRSPMLGVELSRRRLGSRSSSLFVGVVSSFVGPGAMILSGVMMLDSAIAFLTASVFNAVSNKVS